MQIEIQNKNNKLFTYTIKDKQLKKRKRSCCLVDFIDTPFDDVYTFLRILSGGRKIPISEIRIPSDLSE